MIRDGAVLVTRVEEVLEEVGASACTSRSPHRPRLPAHRRLSALAASSTTRCPPRAAQAVAWLATEAGVPPNAVRSALDDWSAGSWSNTSAAAGSARRRDPPRDDERPSRTANRRPDGEPPPGANRRRRTGAPDANRRGPATARDATRRVDATRRGHDPRDVEPPGDDGQPLPGGHAVG
jgi:hypothetical protein